MGGSLSWRAAACAAVVVALLPARGRAEQGAVELRSHTYVTGDVRAIVPGRSVEVLLVDGRTRELPWADVLFVYDGPRVVDAAGNVTTFGASPVEALSPAPATTDATPATTTTPPAEEPASAPMPSTAPSGGPLPPVVASRHGPFDDREVLPERTGSVPRTLEEAIAEDANRRHDRRLRRRRATLIAFGTLVVPAGMFGCAIAEDAGVSRRRCLITTATIGASVDLATIVATVRRRPAQAGASR